MCGLFGVVSNSLIKKEEDTAAQLGIVSSLRGNHSTGVGLVGYNHTDKGFYGVYSKRTGNPYDLFDSKSYDRLLSHHNKRILIGHCRYATKGLINNNNAHPFLSESGNILGAHNGTIYGYSRPDHFGTDSEALINMLDDEGVHAAIPKLTGAWAITWFDFRNNSFNILRNDQRSLYVGVVSGEQVMYYASEAEMLTLVMERNSIYKYEIVPIEVNKLHSWDISDSYKWFKSLEIKEIKGKEVPKTPVIPFLPATNNSPYRSGYANPKEEEKKEEVKTKTTDSSETTPSSSKKTGQSEQKPPTDSASSASTASTTTTTTTTKEAGKDTATPFRIKYHKRHTGSTRLGFGAYSISPTEYDRKLDHGCAWCGELVDIGDEFVWLDAQHVLCKPCMETPETREAMTMFYPNM